MREVVTRQLYTYWNEVRGDRLAPLRFEIEPSRLAGILPDTFILEREDAKSVRFRLAGTRICEAFVEEFRGVNFFSLFELSDRIVLQSQFEAIANQGAVGVFTIEGTTGSGLTAAFEVLVLPLVHNSETVDRFMGSISPLAHFDWLGREPLTKKKLLRDELVWPEGRPRAIVEASNRQSPFLPHIRNARIVRSDRRQFRVYDGGLLKDSNDR